MAGVVSVPFAGGFYEVHDFYAQYRDGTVRAGSDAADARWFTAEELPALSLSDGLLDYLTLYNVYP
jgi:8-oxo-dGTP diphosphatase